MMKRIFNIFILICLAANINAQTKAINSLKEEQKRTRERLAMTSKLLDQNKKNTASSFDRLNMLNKQITDRQLLIQQINDEIGLLDKEIDKTNTEIEEETKALESVKKEYAQLMHQAYVNRDSHNKLMFILSAQNFSQSYRRLRYLQELSYYRKNQAEQIKIKTEELENKRNELDNSKKAKETVLASRARENEKLLREKNDQSVLIAGLQKNEEELRKELKVQQKLMDDQNNKIAKLIAEEERRREEEERKAREKAAKAGGQKQPTQQGSAQYANKEDQLISGNFENNKGRMPWPVEKGVIVGKYGMQAHAVLTHVTINNKGIYIQTEKDTDARSVFEGVVTQRFTTPGNNNAVIVRHGDYRTVYSNLTDIYVKEGDKVTAKQKIGRIYTDTEDGNKTTLYFMVWKEKELQNPESFLAK
jgi:septal ring factor EnvC (AmiA/AmiB activator)